MMNRRNTDAAIVVMAKEPDPGNTKTRLVPPLTFQQAAALYEALLLDTIAMVSSLTCVDLAFALTPPDSVKYFEQIAPINTILLPIEGVDFGYCLTQAIGKLLELDYNKVIALNTDGPTLPKDYLLQALRLLDEWDVVFGEGHDGGYYLVGMKCLHEELFQKIDWSTSKVLNQSIQQASDLGLSVELTPRWYDIDTIQDLKRLKKEISDFPEQNLIHSRQFINSLDFI